MTPQELQDWLLTDGIEEDLNKLLQLTVVTEIDNFAPSIDTDGLLQQIDWDRLMLAGSILSRSTERAHQEAALRIATSALMLSNRIPVKDAGAILFEKLANHRAIDLGAERALIEPALHDRLGVSQRLEAQRRTLDYSVLVDATGKRLAVNQFQLEFWEGAERRDAWMSASAPTASGKTFLVSNWLVNNLKAGGYNTAVYLAPTRALVTEVEESLKNTLKDFAGSAIEVTSLPMVEKFMAAQDGSGKTIFVLTQERLHLLLNALDDNMSLDLLVVWSWIDTSKTLVEAHGRLSFLCFFCEVFKQTSGPIGICEYLDLDPNPQR